MSYETLLYDTADAVATITLNRPERLNTIVPPMPDEIEAAIDRVTGDEVLALAHELFADERMGLCVVGPVDAASLRWHDAVVVT